MFSQSNCEVNVQYSRIPEALLDLCFERGYAKIDLPMLLERAGVDERAFHGRYADLEDCFCVTYIELRDDFFARVQRAVAAESNWRDRLRATAYAFFRFLREDARVAHLSVVEVGSAGERPRQLFADAFDSLFDLLDEGRAEMADPDSLTRATAVGVGAGIFSQIHEAVQGGTLEEQAVPQLMGRLCSHPRAQRWLRRSCVSRRRRVERRCRIDRRTGAKTLSAAGRRRWRSHRPALGR